jgi:hypothetical protein
VSKFRLNFVSYPTKRRLGGVLDPNDIQGAEFTIKVPGASVFGTLGSVVYPVKTFLTADFSTLGAYSFRGVCVLKNGKKSLPVEVSFNLADDSEPEVLLDLSVVVEP